ncbi:hypothetical protein LSAT2_018724, partial [Lamellibrachia satsuma]
CRFFDQRLGVRSPTETSALRCRFFDQRLEVRSPTETPGGTVASMSAQKPNPSYGQLTAAMSPLSVVPILLSYRIQMWREEVCGIVWLRTGFPPKSSPRSH